MPTRRPLRRARARYFRRPVRTPPTLPFALLALAALSPLILAACGNTLQNEALQPSFFQPLITQTRFPVFWLGTSFRRLPVINVQQDPGGAYLLQYGNCTQGGENVCLTPLEIVTSPDNGFLPGGQIAHQPISIRGVRGVAMQNGSTLALPTGGVVVDIYADSPGLARAAAAAMVTINAVQTPGSRLAPPLPDTGWAQRPLEFQRPAPASPDPRVAVD
ncbi:MAG TPA: hypothetical protein VMU32_09745 [Solirubrobacteraceae bacterium]|nr:hypothetical protein [Solirubrobacteraceae bacterium]